MIISRLARMAVAAPLVAALAVAMASPRLTVLATAAALTISALTLWRPTVGLVLVAGLAPAGRLFAPAPALAAEVFVWAFLAAWLLGVWRPLMPAGPAEDGPAGTRRFSRITVAALYCAVLVASWLALTLAGAAGVPESALPAFIAHVIPPDYLTLSTEQPETRTMLHSVAGVVMFMAAAGLMSADRKAGRILVMTLVSSTAILAVATLGSVLRLWAAAGYTREFLLRFGSIERLSLHLPDVNAAGSLYALASLCAIALAVRNSERRWRWVATAVVMAPAAVIAGSRTSFVAFAAGLLLIAVSVSRWRPGRAQRLAATAAVMAVALAAVFAANWSAEFVGAGRAVSLRSQFTESSLRMMSSAPVYGVGVGKYFDRSGEFFTPELRRVYANENAHNYFFQQFAELGIVGGMLFVALIGTVLFAGWREVQATRADAAVLALFTGAAAYLLTCLTGHPLLVPEAAMPFWIALGAVAGLSPQPARAGLPAARAIAAAVLVLLAANLAVAYRSYAAVTAAPDRYGFHEPETSADGTSFRWMTRHAVAYIEDGRGFLRIVARAPARESSGEMPFTLETSVAGRVVDRRELPFDRWVTYDIPVREPSGLPFRRVDLWLNRVDWEPVRLGTRAAERPLGVMIGEIHWIGLAGVAG